MYLIRTKEILQSTFLKKLKINLNIFITFLINYITMIMKVY